VLIEGLLRRQAGVISRAQAIESGMSADAVQRKLGSGRWERLHPGVYLAADHEYGDEARLRAAMLWAGEGATVHGLSAAWWHGIVAELPATVQITVPRARRAGRRSGLLVRRRDLATADHVPLRLLQVTDVPLTVLEAAISLGPAGSALLDRALQRTVRFPAVYRAHCRNLGRRGSPAASALLTAAADRAASQAERRLVRLLREQASRVGASVTGAGPSSSTWPSPLSASPSRWTAGRGMSTRNDSWRIGNGQNALVTAGWTVLRFTWHDLEQRGTRVIAEIRAALHHLP
jgi:hypothetical protein